MKKIILLLGFLSIIITSCEKDDYCLKNPVTPNLILRFYDDSNRKTLKSVEELYVWSTGKDSIFSKVKSDSIYLPLNSNTNKTVYHLSNGSSVDTFTITYTPEEEFVSRSCGFKINFQEVSFSSDTFWIKDFTPSSLTTIDSQNAAHVQIYH